MEELSLELKSFKRRVEITRDARFQANLRLSRRNRVSTYAISILSLAVIGMSMAQTFAEIGRGEQNFIFGSTIVLSVFVIIVTWMESSGNHLKRGEELHRCARKISKIYYELSTINPAIDGFRERMDKLHKEYLDALDDCYENHDNVDYYRVRANNPKLFPDYYTGPAWLNFVRCYYNKAHVFIREFLWLFPPVAVFFGSTYGVYRVVVGAM